MTQVPSNLIPTRITQLPESPTSSPDGYLVFVYEGRTYKIRAGDIVTGAIPDGSITTAKLAGGAVTPDKLSVSYAQSGDNTDITSLSNLDSLTFTETPDSSAPRRMSWNSTEGTADLFLLDGTVLQVGQEQLYRARNKSGATIADGTVVWATGADGNSGRISIGPAIANGSQPGKTVMGIGITLMK